MEGSGHTPPFLRARSRPRSFQLRTNRTRAQSESTNSPQRSSPTRAYRPLTPVGGSITSTPVAIVTRIQTIETSPESRRNRPSSSRGSSRGRTPPRRSTRSGTAATSSRGHGNRNSTASRNRRSSSRSRGSSSSSGSGSRTRRRRTSTSSSASSRQSRSRTRQGNRSREQNNGSADPDNHLRVEPRDSSTSTSSYHSVLVVGGQRPRSGRHLHPKPRVSFALPDPSTTRSDIVRRVFETEKCLKLILSYMNWNELLVMRSVCKQWQDMVSKDPKFKEASIITVRKDFLAFSIFNESPVIWTQFRILAPRLIDMSDATQFAFWNKHGPNITFLDLRSPLMTSSGLIEVLSHCPNLIEFSVLWNPEMYSFNQELIKQYYGFNIRNGALARMKSLTVEKSSFLTDNALLSILKWCGSNLQQLSLTCPQDDVDDLNRLKPRWTIEPIETFTNRFSYARNLKSLDFSGSNLSPADLTRLGDMEKLKHLTAMKLSRCKVDDASTIHFIKQKGPKLEQLYLDYTPITDRVFAKEMNLKKLLLLNISGTKNIKNIDFLPELVNLEQLYCAETGWLNYIMLQKPIEEHSLNKELRKVNFSNSERFISKNFDEKQRSLWFLRFCLMLKSLTELNLDGWSTFGTNENFKAICVNIPNLKKLRVRGWGNLTDEGITGLTYEDLGKMEDADKDIWAITKIRLQKQSLARLQGLRLIDLGGCIQLTDTSIQFGILYLPNLRYLSLNGSKITDVGIHVLIARCKTLDRLSLLGCNQVSPKGKRINRLDGRTVQFGSIKFK